MIRNNFREVKKNYQRTVQLFLTQRCDLNCGFCFRKGVEIDDMPLEVAKEIISRYPGANAKISFTGGEPTLNQGLEDMLEHCSALSVDSEIYTNGMHDFNSFSTQVRLRYDGLDRGHKRMEIKRYRGRYELGLLVNGNNTEQLLRCLHATEGDPQFEGVIQVTEIAKNKRPVCGVEVYAREAEFIANYASENCAWINQIEISVGHLGIDTGVPKCRFERYIEGKVAGICPHNRVASECSGCLFQKQVYVRV